MPRTMLLTPLAILSAALLLAPLAVAGPSGGSGTPGVSIMRNGNAWTIVAPDGSVINWDSFDVSRNEMVQFIQGGDLARVLNRITGPDGTMIDGTITADGVVYIVNPAGVAFGPNAVIDAGGIYAAAGNLSDEDFQNGVDRFTDLQGNVVNAGQITARDVNLIGQHVANFGQVSGTGGGYITMLAGDEVLIQRVGERIVVRIDGVRLTDRARPYDGPANPPGAPQQAGVLNQGTVNNPGSGIVLGAGDHYALAIHNLGEVRAAAGEIQAVAASGLVSNDATMSVDATTGDAGRVVLQGPKVQNGGFISADAPNGAAGEILMDSTSGIKIQIGSTTSARGADGTGEIIARTSGARLALGGIVDTSGTALFEAPGIVVVRTTVTADVLQRYSGPVRLLLDSSMLGGTVRFLDTVDAGQLLLGGLTMRGLVRFDGAVGASAPLQFIDVDGDTIFAGGLVRTVEFQRYLGDVSLQLDTTVESTGDALVRFGGAVDGRHALVVRTAGVTRFDGPIGGARALTRLVTGGGGSTRLGGNVNARVIILRDDATLTSDVRMRGDRAELARVTGHGFGLTVQGRRTLFGGPLTGLSHLKTDAAGTTEISGGIVSARDIRFGDAVRLLADLSIDGSRVELAGLVDGPFDLEVNAARWARFGDDVGGLAPLASLLVQAGDAPDVNTIVFGGAVVQALGDIQLNPGGRAVPALIATIAGTGPSLAIHSSAGDVTLGRNEKLTSLGDLSIVAAGLATVGDLNANGAMLVDAGAIRIRTRPPGLTLTSRGGVVTDRGVEIIATGDVVFTTRPTLLGAGAAPIIATRDGTISSTLRSFTTLDFSTLRTSDFTLGALVLDLTPFSDVNLADALDDNYRPARRGLTPDAVSTRPLERLGVYVRALTAAEQLSYVQGAGVSSDLIAEEEPGPGRTAERRLRRAAVEEALNQYAQLLAPGDGDATDLQSAAAIRRTLDEAWTGYRGRVLPEDVSPRGFREHLEVTAYDEDALAYLDGLRDLLRELRTMGLSPLEQRHSVEVVLGPIAPSELEVGGLEAAAEGRWGTF